MASEANQLRLVRQLTGGSDYLGQVRKVISIPGAPYLLSTTITTGVISSNVAMSPPTLVSGWSTRLNAFWSSYRVLRHRVSVRPLTSATGVTKFFFIPPDDGYAGGTIAALEANQRQGYILDNAQAQQKSVRTLKYTAKSIDELQLARIDQAPAQPVYFAVYTNNADYGAPVAVTQLWLVQPTFDIEFIGMASQ